MAPLDEGPGDERVLRARRILDTAAELLVTWGYRRVTVDDVARRAGVGKGTVYLHFSTKEMLFVAVLTRSRIRMIEQIVRDVGDDPAAVMPARQARAAFLMVHDDPVARAVFTGDIETLGELSRIAMKYGDLSAVREHTLEDYFKVLRELGLVRADTPLALQIHAYAAVMTGFVTIEPLMATDMIHAEAKADVLEQVVRAAFETGDDPAALRAAAGRIIPVYRRLLAHLREELGRHIQT